MNITKTGSYPTSPTLPVKYHYVERTTCEKVTCVVLWIFTFGIWTYIKNCQLEKALQTGNIKCAEKAIREGATHQISLEFFQKLIDMGKKEVVLFMGEQATQPHTDALTAHLILRAFTADTFDMIYYLRCTSERRKFKDASWRHVEKPNYVDSVIQTLFFTALVAKDRVKSDIFRAKGISVDHYGLPNPPYSYGYSDLLGFWIGDCQWNVDRALPTIGRTAIMEAFMRDDVSCLDLLLEKHQADPKALLELCTNPAYANLKPQNCMNYLMQKGKYPQIIRELFHYWCKKNMSVALTFDGYLPKEEQFHLYLNKPLPSGYVPVVDAFLRGDVRSLKWLLEEKKADAKPLLEVTSYRTNFNGGTPEQLAPCIEYLMQAKLNKG